MPEQNQQTSTPATAAITRMQQLQQMLEQAPADAFLLYGIAMEHKKSGDAARAVEYFDRTIQVDPGYCYAYYQRGQVLESRGDEEAARQAYRAGIEAAVKNGDAHARSELEAALDLLGG
jgi:tetratricopeptide (TPR) repeat protein